MESGKDYNKPVGKGLAIAGWIFALLGGFIGIGISCAVVFAKAKMEGGEKVNLYNEAGRTMGKILMAVSIISSLAWKSISS